MKQKISHYSWQLLILLLAGLILLLMIQVSQAQTEWDNAMGRSFKQMGVKNQNGNLVASNQNSQQRVNDLQTRTSGNSLSMRMPQKSPLKKALENTTLSYYQQFLGPTLSGPSTETYNVFQEGVDDPGTGRAPLQSFHAANLRYKLSENWAIGASVAMANGYTGDVVNRSQIGQADVVNRKEVQWFNARAYVSLPSLELPFGTLYSTVMYEAPTSDISQNDEMTWGYVISESFAFKLPSYKWTAGIMGQIYRIHYKDDVIVEEGYIRQLQTLIVSGGPYVNYRFNDNWMMGSMVILDWDQKGVQTGSREFGNNLPHRARVTGTYFPHMKYLSSVGVFTQALLDFSPETTAVGAELALKF